MPCLLVHTLVDFWMFSLYMLCIGILFQCTKYFVLISMFFLNLVTTVYQGVEFKDEAKTEIRQLPVSLTFNQCQYIYKELRNLQC